MLEAAFLNMEKGVFLQFQKKKIFTVLYWAYVSLESEVKLWLNQCQSLGTNKSFLFLMFMSYMIFSEKSLVS